MSQDRQIFAADDWGLTPGINHGILALGRAGLLRSVSCLGNAPFLGEGLPELLALPDVELWMHFDLTYGSPVGGLHSSLTTRRAARFPGHKNLLLRSILGLLRQDDLEAEFKAQLARLSSMQIPVSGINGHHHVHLLPAVFDAIARATGEGAAMKFRMMCDRDHPGSYLQTRYFSLRRPFAGQYFTLEKCYYLRKSDLSSKETLASKRALAGASPLLAHPALYDDFLSVGVSDCLRVERVNELAAILELSR